MSSDDKAEFDPSRRRLCPDGACIGLLDDAGTCKECGLTASGERLQTMPSDEVAPEFEDDDASAPMTADAEAGAQASAQGSDEAGFDSKRKLCPDGACVGVIGPDGRCKVCGRAG